MNCAVNPSVFLTVATLTFAAIGVASGSEAPAIPAFPGAEGYGDTESTPKGAGAA